MKEDPKMMAFAWAAMLPGIRKAMETLQSLEKEVQETVALWQAQVAAGATAPRRGRPPKTVPAPAPVARTVRPVARTVRPVAAKRHGSGRQTVALQKNALPRLIDGQHTVASVAAEVGLSTAWGLILFLRQSDIPYKKVPGPGGRRVNVISQANYERVLALRKKEAA